MWHRQHSHGTQCNNRTESTPASQRQLEQLEKYQNSHVRRKCLNPIYWWKHVFCTFTRYICYNCTVLNFYTSLPLIRATKSLQIQWLAVKMSSVTWSTLFAYCWAPLRIFAATDKIGNMNETHKPIWVNCLQQEWAGRMSLQLVSAIISTKKDLRQGSYEGISVPYLPFC